MFLCAQSLLINQDCVNKCGIEHIVKLQVSTERKHLNKLAHTNTVCYSRKVLIGKINALIWFHCIKKDEDQPDYLKIKEKTRNLRIAEKKSIS